MTSIFAQLGTQWGAIYYQKVSGGQKIKEGAWLVLEIGFKRYRFLTIAGGTELGIRTLPDSSKKKVGVTPPHLARDVRASLGMYLVYVVEGHASACPQTVGVDVKYVALTLMKLISEVFASIMKRKNNVQLFFSCYLGSISTIYEVNCFPDF